MTAELAVEPGGAQLHAAWHTATVAEVRRETNGGVRLTLEVPTWPGSEAGSHLDLRLTAPDGYQASRSYSIASSTPGENVVLAVDELPDGEVSPFLVQDARSGDQVEIHGPLGSFFIWRPGETTRPVQLIAGGSGVVPLYAMAAAHGASGDSAPFRMLYSVRSPADGFFAEDLSALVGPAFGLDLVYTREAPDSWSGTVGRIDKDALAGSTMPPELRPRIYVCGSTRFVETVAVWLQEIGHAAQDIHTERFGGL